MTGAGGRIRSLRLRHHGASCVTSPALADAAILPALLTLSQRSFRFESCSPFSDCFMAEEVGFEPTELSFNGFQDRRLKPLGHSSVASTESLILPKNFGNVTNIGAKCKSK